MESLKIGILAVALVTVTACTQKGTLGGNISDALGTSTGASTGSPNPSCAVTQNCSVNLSWNAPTQNTDGSALTNLAGYKVYYGNSSNSLTQVINVNNQTSFSVKNLGSGTYFFAVTSYNSSGVESQPSIQVTQSF